MFYSAIPQQYNGMTKSSNKLILRSVKEQISKMPKDPAAKIASFWSSYEKQGLNLSRNTERFVQHYESCCDRVKENRKVVTSGT